MNNYVIGGNVCNAFVLGEIGASDDFFLVGAEPPEESPYPLLTGNIFGSDGQPLFQLVRNVITLNPGNCSRISGDSLGYEIRYPHAPDDPEHLIFRVRTTFEVLPGRQQPCYVTTLEGNFYNNKGNLMFAAHSGTEADRVEVNTKHAFGFMPPGGWGAVVGMSHDEIQFAAFAALSRGTIHQRMQGVIEKQRFTLDGKFLFNATVRDCDIDILSGDFSCIGTRFEDCRFHFAGNAANIFEIAKMFAPQSPKNLSRGG